MNKPSERIVVFVTTAQKRAITATAADLGISVSELMRRAVLSFGATSEQVKAASIVDRLNTPRAPDALDAALQRVARGTRQTRAALPAALQTRGNGEAAASTENAAAAAGTGAEPTRDPLPRSPLSAESTPLLPADVSAALAAGVDEEAAATAAAVARVAAAEAASAERLATQQTDTQAQMRSVFKRPRIDGARDEDDPLSDPSTGGGRFA
ncbi:MAG TPA: hypothetical protein VEN30_16835 [Paraburkholderia sp.]|nr:hypothetical protein [Paraburkholderia sp.]